jgi:tetratricopeptide (TPR) repeat protein
MVLAKPASSPNPARHALAASRPSLIPTDNEAVNSVFIRDIATGRAQIKTSAGAAPVDLVKLRKAMPHLKRAAKAVSQQDYALAGREALIALDIDNTIALANHLAAVVMEKLNKLDVALKLYERTLQLDPEQYEAYSNLGHLAWKMRMMDTAERFFRLFLKVCPTHPNAALNLAAVLREQKRYGDATDLLRAELMTRPQDPKLWNALGTVCLEATDLDNALIFFQEAKNLRPESGFADHNIGFVHMMMGEPEAGVTFIESGIASGQLPLGDLQEANFALAQCQLALGDLDRGWQGYRARFHQNFAKAMRFLCPRPEWAGESLSGKHIVLMAEQGVGDEVMFLSIVGDLQAAVGPEGKVSVATDRRLSPIVEKAFPGVACHAHGAGELNGRRGRIAVGVNWNAVDYWVPMASSMQWLRPTLESFPREAYLKPDPARIAHWRAWIDSLPGTLKVGAVLRSSLMSHGRSKYLPRLDELAPVFRQPGISWINLQYGDATADFKLLRDTYGVEMVTPPDIDLKDHLDDLSALCAALDLFVGPITATGHIASAAGAQTLLFGPPRIWMYLGSNGLPWYSRAEVFQPPRLGEWKPAMERIQVRLATEIAGRSGVSTKGKSEKAA